MITCKQASQLISQSLDQRLNLRDRIKLRLHLLICSICSRFNHQLSQLRRALKALSLNTENDHSIQLPSEAKARISSQITNAFESNNR